MRNFPLTKRLILAALAILFLVDATLAYYNLKMSSDRESPQLILSAQTRQLALLKADVKRAGDIKTKIPDVLKSFDQFEATLLPATKGYSVITQEMNEVAKSTHAQIEDTKFHSKEVAGRNLTEVELESTISGDYTGIVRFLNGLQRSENVYIVDSLELDSQTAGQGPPGSLRVNLHLRTYFRKV
jgi:type IV pilus assembly protein PilO